MKDISILEAPIFSDYFAEFINSDDEYSITDEFMKENIFITGICNCGESFCSTVHLITKQPLKQSNQVVKSNRFDNKLIHLHVDNEFLEFEAMGGIFPYKNEILKLVSTKMYLDDLRTPIEEFDFIVRSYDEAIATIKKHGVPNFISFDLDLGTDENGTLLKTGYDLAKWLVNSDLDDIYKLPSNFRFKVHSQNPVGKQNIISILDSYLAHISRHKDV